jgi:hypothetical protein
MKTTTVKEIKDFFEMQLAPYSDDTQVTIANGLLSLCRAKQRGENRVDIEFNEVITGIHDSSTD